VIGRKEREEGNDAGMQGGGREREDNPTYKRKDTLSHTKSHTYTHVHTQDTHTHTHTHQSEFEDT
jgi:hypothetical protein